MTGDVSKPDRRKDSLLAHCIFRAVIAEHPDPESAQRAMQTKDGEKLSQWSMLKAVVRVTPKASRVASFVVCWAIAMRAEGVDSYSITEYQRYWSEGERQAYRVQNEFRELWPEFETPNELARQIIRSSESKLNASDVAKLPTSLMVLA